MKIKFNLFLFSYIIITGKLFFFLKTSVIFKAKNTNQYIDIKISQS